MRITMAMIMYAYHWILRSIISHFVGVLYAFGPMCKLSSSILVFWAYNICKYRWNEVLEYHRQYPNIQVSMTLALRIYSLHFTPFLLRYWISYRRDCFTPNCFNPSAVTCRLFNARLWTAGTNNGDNSLKLFIFSSVTCLHFFASYHAVLKPSMDIYYCLLFERYRSFSGDFRCYHRIISNT